MALWLSRWFRPTRRLDLTWVTPQLAVGGRFDADQVPDLAKAGIRAVVDLRSEHCDDAVLLARHGIQFLHLPVADTHAPTAEQLERALDWIARHLAEERPLFVHCHGGQGRSVTLVCAVLIRQGYSLAAAYDLVRRRRWHVAPTEAQLACLRDLTADGHHDSTCCAC
ncbi:MAG: dual specificity protein phosphatase family protein [Chloroflexi bacterium]|nr:dual specificity protein phosphatase family protein [Chloroflexota bacterium]